ncbi:hypothetical protein QYF61_018450 [Mycteria americana]|uniref:Uncharacterized protein n=1 Tax=Mycteria americana TaxID=33587 RepID=A0AAN7RHQ4_MYCAM|nr:hypothetical protein QYF61_018450 [Mycteria americana]
MIFPGTEVRLTVGGTLLPQSPSCGPSTREVWEERLPLKTEAKNLLSTSAFSSSVVTSLPVVFIRGEALLIILSIPCQAQLQPCLGLPDPIQPGSVPILFPGYLSLLPLPVEVCLPKIQGPDYTLHLTHIPQDCKLHQCMITAAQMKVFTEMRCNLAILQEKDFPVEDPKMLSKRRPQSQFKPEDKEATMSAEAANLEIRKEMARLETMKGPNEEREDPRP